MLKYLGKITGALLGACTRTLFNLIKNLVVLPTTLIFFFGIGIHYFLKTASRLIYFLFNLDLKEALLQALILPFIFCLTILNSVALIQFSLLSLPLAPVIGLVLGWENYFEVINLLWKDSEKLIKAIKQGLVYVRSWEPLDGLDALTVFMRIDIFFTSRLFPEMGLPDFERNIQQMLYYAHNRSTSFESFACSNEECARIKAKKTEPLTTKQREQIEKTNPKLLEKYDDILRKLAEHCPILVDYPDRNDAILLIKQEKINNKWQTGSYTVFSCRQLMAWYAHSPTNPISRERIKNSNNTRFKYHPLYMDEHGDAVSEELYDTLAEIRCHLLKQITPKVNHMPCERLTNSSHFNLFSLFYNPPRNREKEDAITQNTYINSI